MSTGSHREVNNYVLLELIGSGGMSKVWRARQKESDRETAVKVIPIEDLAPDFERRLRREPEIHHGLRHPNIVPLLDWFREGDEFLLVMEYVRGNPLSKILHGGSGPLPFSRARDYMRGILRAVHHLHEHGIIHRDIKPGNILIGPDDEPKLTDFGIAKFAWQQGETRTQKGLGTPEYMSPEQVRGGEIDHRTDIYSLGITFFEMLTGRKPFARGEETPAHYAEVVGKILNEPLPDPRQFVPGIPDGVMPLLRKATAKNPAERFQSCAEFLGALEVIDERAVTPYRDPDATVVLNAVPSPSATTVVSPPASPGPVTSRLAQEEEEAKGGKGGLIITIVILLLAAGGYFGYQWYQNQRQERMKPLTQEMAMEISQELARDYKRFSFDGNVPALVTLYAMEDVDYFRLLNVGRDEIREDAEKFFARIERTERLDVEVSRVAVTNDSTFTTRWVITYERVKDDGTILRGEAVHDLTVSRFDDDWLIVKERQRSIRRNDQAAPPPVDTAAVDTGAAEPETPPQNEQPSAPSESEMRSAVQSIILLANNGQAAQAWNQYASSELKGKMGGFPGTIPEGSISLRSVSVDGSNAVATVVRSSGFAQKEMTIRFTFAAEDGLKMTSVSVSE